MKQTDISEWFKEHDIEEIEVIVPDMAGVARGKMLPVEKFLEQTTLHDLWEKIVGNKKVSKNLNPILRKIVSTEEGTAGFANVSGY